MHNMAKASHDLKNCVTLAPINLFDRVYVYLDNYITDREGVSLLGILHRMLQTGNFYPTTSWALAST